MWRVLYRDGIDAVTVRSVAAEAGLSKATLAHYFDSQNDLLMFALTESMADAQARLSTIDLAKGNMSTVEDAIDESMPTSAKKKRLSDVWLAVVSRTQSSPELREHLRLFDADVRKDIESALTLMKQRKLMASGRNVKVEAQRLHALMDGLALHTHTDPKALSAKDVRQVIKTHLNDLKR